MRAPELVVTREVVVDMVRLAAEEVPGVLRVGHGGPGWLAFRHGDPVRVRLEDGRVEVRVVVVARPAQSLVALARGVRTSVAAACERLLGLDAASVTVIVDGVGA